MKEHSNTTKIFSNELLQTNVSWSHGNTCYAM